MIVDRNLVVCLTGAAGQIAYALLPALCDGSIFGREQVNNPRFHRNNFMQLFYRKLI
jgi:hypothetical protein